MNDSVVVDRERTCGWEYESDLKWDREIRNGGEEELVFGK
jgi:hypothetical protein